MNDTGCFRVRVPRWFVPVTALLQFILFGYFLARTMIRPPFMDMLAWLAFYEYFRDHGGLGWYLWAFHNEHHLVWVRILTVIDVEFLRGSGVAFIAAGTAALAASATMVFMVIRRGDQSSGSMPRAGWLAAMLMLTSANAVDCGIPINTVYPIAAFFMVGSIVLFTSEAPRRRMFALPMAAGAALGNGAGLVIWPVLVWVAWRQQTGLIRTATIALLGMIFIGIYTHGMPSTTPLAEALRSHPFGSSNVLKQMDYALAYLGLPFTRAPGLEMFSRCVGLAFLLAGLFAFVRISLSPQANTPLNRFAAALILITLGSAMMAAIGRANLEPGVKIPVRYTVLVAPMHIGVLVLVTRALGHRCRTTLRGLAAPGCAVTLLVMQVMIGLPAIRVSHAMRQAIEAYYRGDRDPEVARFVYSDVASADRLTGLLRDRGLLHPK